MVFAPADDAFVTSLSKDVPEDVFRKAEERYLQEPRGRWKGGAGWVALPRSTAQVAAIVAAACRQNVAIVPYGGGTGLVGGQIAEGLDRPLILSLERMNTIREVHPNEDVLIAEAGCILADVQAAAANAGRLFPLSLASEGSAQIGGLLSTNAGGVNTLRYGNARAQVLGLEAVLPDGRIWNGLKRLRKDNTGYDLRNLLMGAEGSLGVLTAAALQLSPRPNQDGTALFVVPSPAAALDLLSLARAHLGEGISAFELIDKTGLSFLQETLPDIRLPFDVLPAWSVLVDVGLFGGTAVPPLLEQLFADALDAGLVSDGFVAQSEAQRQAFWTIREHIPEANRRIGAVSSHDISVPLGEIPNFISRGKQELARLAPFRINCFGHIGDGNLHFNVFPDAGKSRDDYADLRGAVKHLVHELTHALGGSVSAEHGVGRLKVTDLERYGDPVKLAAMRAIKSALDPKGIMNPGAVLPVAPPGS